MKISNVYMFEVNSELPLNYTNSGVNLDAPCPTFKDCFNCTLASCKWVKINN